MSQEILVSVSANVASAVKGIDKTREALGDLNDLQMETLQEIKKANDTNTKAIDKLTKTTKKAEGGFKSLFKVLKGAAILTVIVKAVQAIGSAFAANQVVADKFAAVTSTVASVTRQVADAFVNAARAVNDATGGFDATKKVISDLVTLGFTPLMFTIDLIKGAIYGTQLAWEQSFFGDGDQKTIDDLNKKLEKTGASLSETFNEAKSAAVGIYENFGEAASEIGKVAEVASETIKDINIQNTFADQERLTQLRNQTRLAIAENEKLQFVYQREAELQRQIRDDLTLSVADRQKANDELAVVLQKQLELQEANALKQLELAQFELSMNKDNIDLKEQLLLAEKNLADVRENITGFESEQLVNKQGLELEAIDLINSKADAEAARALKQKQFEAEQLGIESEKTAKMIENLAIEKEIEEQRLQGQIDRYKAGTQARQDAEQALLDFRQDIANREIELEAKLADAKIVEAEKELQNKKKVEAQKLAVTAQTFGALAGILGENSAAGKAAAIAQATINTYQGVTEVLANKSTLPQPFATIEKIASIATVLGTGFKTVKEITATKTPSIKGGKSVGSSGGRGVNTSVATAPATPPSFNVVGANATSQLAETINKKQSEPVKAYVVSNDVTSAQSMERNIVENASI